LRVTAIHLLQNAVFINAAGTEGQEHTASAELLWLHWPFSSRPFVDLTCLLLLQRPDLYGAALAHVGVMDM
jgi:hypothetical protein